MTKLSLLLLAASALAACGGGGSSGSNAPNTPSEGTLSIQITDAPVDGVTGITVEFTGITVNPSNGEHLDFEFNSPISIDLTTLTQGNTATLLDAQVLPVGQYDWIRLDVNAECDAEFDSFVDEDTGGQVELRVPSARGLQLGNGFVITANQNTGFVIDWDTRLGLVDPQGSSCYKLRPTLRIVDMTAYGSIAGTVDPLLISAAQCTSDPTTEVGNVVYVFEGTDIVPDDIDGIDPDPVATANVRYDPTSDTYRYMAAFLEPIDYTAAFTCQGRNDVVPDEDDPDLIDDNDIEFSTPVNVLVLDGQTATANFN